MRDIPPIELDIRGRLATVGFLSLLVGTTVSCYKDDGVGGGVQSGAPSCVRAGCSSQLCVDARQTESGGSTCEYRPEYACFRNAICESQADGRCGFTPSAALTACLAAVGSCTHAGTVYETGASFSAGDGCNQCTCTASGQVACTAKSCEPTPCDFHAAYQYGFAGGDLPYEYRSYLAPGNVYKHVRRSTPDHVVERSCAPPLPSCGALDVISSYDVEVHDLPNADVQFALSQPTPPFYGRDLRPVDAPAFEFLRADGRGFRVGADCALGSGDCVPVPAGIARLQKRLQDLDAEQSAAPECKSAGF